MVPNEKKLLKVLSNNDVTFFIPPYQRNYEWTEDQCSVFLEDILKTTNSNLRGINTEHFFGTITFFETEGDFDEPSKLVLIDGQQRITTTMLFLIAIRDSIEDEQLKRNINEKYLLNRNSTTENEDYKIKLKQVETDWDCYKRLIIDSNDSEIDKQSTIYSNYNYFCNKLSKLKEVGIDYKELIEKGLNKFSIVTIELKPDQNKWENPQEIFESMNSLGKPLSLADLVRNYILLGLTPKDQDKYYKNYWMHIEKILKGRISSFIRDYMQICEKRSFKIATESNYKELYKEFKNLFCDRYLSNGEVVKLNVKDLLKNLYDYSDVYVSVISDITTGSSKVDAVLSDIRYLQVSTAYSFLTALLYEWKKNNSFTETDIVGILQVFFIYCLRRRVIAETNAENKNLPALTKKIEQLIESSDKKAEMFKILSSQEENCRFPNDIELSIRMRDMNFYNFKHCKFILALIEQHLTNCRPQLTDELLQIEHIMPQTINNKQEWLDSLGQDAIDLHQQYVNSIGNLTLIRHNQQLGNKSFREKKEVYVNNAGLQIAKTKIIDCDDWNVDAIKCRGEWLIKYFLDMVAPLPDSMKKRNNYAAKENKKLNFIELQIVGSTINFIKDPTITAKVVDATDVEFEGERIKLSPLTRKIMQRRGECNNSGSYQGAQYWEYDGIRLADII